jgi:pyruvate,water dikinase
MCADAFRSNPMPEAVKDAVSAAYEKLGADTPVAVRSSAVCEDGESASFAGQQETFLNVRGAQEVVRRVQDCWASFFTPRAMFYRAEKGDVTDTRMAVVIQEMIAADKSGVMFTLDPVNKMREHVVIEAVLGLGEGVVSGLITPDHYVINRVDGSSVREFIAPQATAIVCEPDGGTQEIDLAEEHGAARVLSSQQLGCLVNLGVRLEDFFGAPQDVEWCIRGNEIFLLQSRPIPNL